MADQSVGEALVERLLTKVNITVKGRPKRITALEAIFLQLIRHAAGGNRRAQRALLQYKALATPPRPATVEITFVDSPYTKELTIAVEGHRDG